MPNENEKLAAAYFLGAHDAFLQADALHEILSILKSPRFQKALIDNANYMQMDATEKVGAEGIRAIRDIFVNTGWSEQLENLHAKLAKRHERGCLYPHIPELGKGGNENAE